MLPATSSTHRPRPVASSASEIGLRETCLSSSDSSWSTQGMRLCRQPPGKITYTSQTLQDKERKRSPTPSPPLLTCDLESVGVSRVTAESARPRTKHSNSDPYPEPTAITPPEPIKTRTRAHTEYVKPVEGVNQIYCARGGSGTVSKPSFPLY